MADLRALKAYIQNIARQVEQDLPAIAVQVADVAKKLAERRANSEGFGETYSTNEVPAFFFLHKELNAAGKREVERRSKAKEGLTWGAFRQVQGLPSNFVTLNYSGEMWRGMMVVASKRRGNIFYAVLGHTNRSGQAKMGWNFERYGDFLQRLLKADDREYLGEFTVELLIDSIKKIPR